MPGDDLELEQGTEQNVEDESLQEDEESNEAGEGQVSGTGEAENEDPDASDDEGQVDAEPRRPSRAQSRIQTLSDSLRQERERGERVERELRELRAAQQQRERQSQQETPEARAARRALMDPVEVMREDLRESEERTRQLLHQQAMQVQETSDQAEYNGMIRENPKLRRYEAEVEKIRLEQRANGAFVPRKVLLELVVGRAALAAAAKAAPKARQEGQRKIAAQRSEPARAGGDTGTKRGKQGDTLEGRLDGIPI